MSVPLRRCRRAVASTVVVMAMGCGLLACALPAAGPTSNQIEHPFEGPPFTLVKVDEHIVRILAHSNTLFLPPKFHAKHVANKYALRPGDSIAITVYETGGSSLFGSGPNSPSVLNPQPNPQSSASPPAVTTSPGVTTVPPQVIEPDGKITVPYVGRITASNLTPGQLGEQIAAKLQDKTVNPQVIVTLTNGSGNLATVGGEVGQPRQVALSVRGERLLDVIAVAGGARFPPYETYVRIVRNGQIGTILLQTVLNNPSENILVQPNDQIFVIRNPRTFTVIGASQKVSQYTFDTERVSLVEGIARAGGPIDQIGDPTGVYLFRYEPWELARAIWQSPVSEVYQGVPPKFVPILYRIGLTEAGDVFFGQSIQLRDKDVILISNSEASQLLKMLGVVRGFTGVAFDLSRTSN